MFYGVIDYSLLKQSYQWKLSICQHPMYLLIDEDRGEPAVHERVAPWGAPDAEEYVKRVNRNLDSLDNCPGLKIDYDFSAVEIEALCRDFPETGERIRRAHEQGRLDFVNGSFSQAHLQVFGSESTWRQFEMGLAVFEKLFGRRVNVYFTQETGLHEQLPQVLRRFGYDILAFPQFYANMEIIDGRFELGFRNGPTLIEGDEFIDAVALDGTSIPAYLDNRNNAALAHTGDPEKSSLTTSEAARDMYSGPPLWRAIPDLIEVTPEQYESLSRMFEFVAYPAALEKRLREAPPRARARIYTYWSYIEGLWADELLRKHKEAEEIALLTESMDAMGQTVGSRDNKDALEKVWHTILKHQHHDIYWNEVTDLRRKAVIRLDEGIAQCRSIMSEISGSLTKQEKGSTSVFNALPRERRVLIDVPVPLSGNAGSFQRLNDRCFGFVDLPAGGYKSFPVIEGEADNSAEIALPEVLETEHYRIAFTEYGLISKITTSENQDLLKTGDIPGGEIKGMVADTWHNNRRAACCFYEGKTAYILERKSALGHIPLTERYFYFRNEPAIKAEIEFDFSGDEVGCFWLDETKINIYYPTAGGDIHHDIPFGFVQGRERRPLFAINWLHCGGLTYVNRGNCKHWIKNGVIANVIAWGGQGECFSNRNGFGFINRLKESGNSYDLRLYGKHKIEYWLLPTGSFDGREITQKVADLTSPVFISQGAGERAFYEVLDSDLAVTALYAKDGETWARGYKLPSDRSSNLRDFEIFEQKLKPSPQKEK